VAAEQDAARDRVLAARAAFEQEFDGLKVAGRDAVDIPAKIRRNPSKAVAVAAGVGFLALRGPQKVVRGTRRLLFGSPAPMPEAMLPEEIEKSLRAMGSDGDKVRGTLERDFADYAMKAQKNRRGVMLALLLPLLRPVLARGAKAGMEWLSAPGRVDTLRAQTEAAVAQGRDTAGRAGDAAKERIEAAPATDAAAEPEPPTGV
jgi:ElaB/YqjD/DUF883 family membrane-anchored ribosome-binding protein